MRLNYVIIFEWPDHNLTDLLMIILVYLNPVSMCTSVNIREDPFARERRLTRE